ncbi:MAG: hypothetical protein GY846_06280 [Deltaproteobacteria bacterium]|nr:hypothetical protein [Deltaproteobacteria bacterium]
MKRIVTIGLVFFAFLFSHTIAFSNDKKMDETNKAHLLQDILLLNKQISKMNYINKKSRTILKKNKNKYSYEIYLSFVNLYKTFLWCSDISHWLSQTYNDQDNMNSHIYKRLNANRNSIKKTLGYIAKVYGNINDVKLMHIIDTQEKIINSGLNQLDKIIIFLEKIEKKV